MTYTCDLNTFDLTFDLCPLTYGAILTAKV